METPRRRVALYIRVSTPEQKQDGYSPEHQRKRLLAYVNENKTLNLETHESLIFEDVGTGSDLCREELERVRELVQQKKIQGVVVWKIDRLSRNLKHLLTLFEEFQKNDVSFISIQENIDFSGPIGNLIFQIFGAIAQFERELIRGRTYAGKLTSAEQGNYIGRTVPYGYRKVANAGKKGSQLTVVPEEQKWVQQIYDWYVYTGWGDQKIADELNRLKIPLGIGTSHKKHYRWNEKRIRLMLPNPIYYGEHIAIRKDEYGKPLSKKEQTVVLVPPCISEMLYRQAQKARETRSGGFAKTAYMLSGKLRDVSPDLPSPRSFVGAGRTKGGFSYRRKRFKHEESGQYFPTLEIPGKSLDDFVWNRILDAFKEPTVFIRKYLSMRDSGDTTVEKIESQLVSLRKREVEITKIEHPNLENALLEGVFDNDRYQSNAYRLEKELTAVQQDIQKLDSDLEGLLWAQEETHNLEQASDTILKRIDQLNGEQKRILCALFVDRVEISKIERPNAKRQISADVFFRFNLTQLSDPEVGVRTAEEKSDSALTADPGGNNSANGDKGRSGYIPIRVSATLDVQREIRYIEGKHYCHNECYWREEKSAL